MPESRQNSLSDYQLEQLLGRVLQIGVLIAAAVVTLGGVFLLGFHAHWVPQFQTFTGPREALRSVPGIIHQALTLQPDAVVQLGFVLLITTPLLRVVFSLFGFARQRDWLYVVLTLIVTVVLVAGLFGQ